MRSDNLKEAIAEAERFIKKAKAVKARESGFLEEGTKESGACKRASLDLTRALAKMRKGE